MTSQPAADPVPGPVPAPAAVAAAPAPITVLSGGGGKNFLNLSLDGLFAAGASTATDVPALEPGGHDPAQRGFTVQNVEVVFEGAVDPYFRGQANVILQISPEGETVVERSGTILRDGDIIKPILSGKSQTKRTAEAK